MQTLLEIKDLSVHFKTDKAVMRAVNNVSLNVYEGRTLGLVGETGAGKTTTALAILNLVAKPQGRITSGEIIYKGGDLLELPERQMRMIRGNEISMIFQDPMTALNPIHTVGEQIAEVIALHEGCSRQEANEKAREMLERVGIPADRANEYPHQFSGGMKQRVVIAIALACDPLLLIADEPTTALDVTIQAQVMEMINQMKQSNNTAMILITHDLGIVADSCDDVAIMYAGEIVESGSAEHIFEHTAHPYTIGLFESIPRLDVQVKRLKPIHGLMPDPAELPEGCKFHPRCAHCVERCREESPELREIAPGHFVRCHFCTGREEKEL